MDPISSLNHHAGEAVKLVTYWFSQITGGIFRVEGDKMMEAMSVEVDGKVHRPKQWDLHPGYRYDTQNQQFVSQDALRRKRFDRFKIWHDDRAKYIPWSRVTGNDILPDWFGLHSTYPEEKLKHARPVTRPPPG